MDSTVIIPFYAIRDASLNLDDLNQLEATPVAQMDFTIPLAPAQGPRELAVQLRFGRPPFPWNAVGEATKWRNCWHHADSATVTWLSVGPHPVG